MPRSLALWRGSTPAVTPRVLLFVAAFAQEFSGFLKRCNDVNILKLPVHWARSGTFRGEPFLAVANGAGAARASAAISAAEARAIINIGFCGALEPSLRIAEVFIADRVNGEDINLPRSSPAAMRGTLASIDHVVQSADEKRRLRETGAMAVEMEARGALQRARTLGVPFYSIRVVSDLATETLHCDFNRALRDDGRISIARLSVEALTHPFTCLPELLRLRNRSVMASERLGEFLARCEF